MDFLYLHGIFLFKVTTMATKRTFILNIRKRQFKFLGHIIRKAVSKNLIFPGQIEGKRASNAQPTWRD